MTNELQADLNGWWRILETSQWVNDGLDDQLHSGHGFRFSEGRTDRRDCSTVAIASVAIWLESLLGRPSAWVLPLP
jgi:hypothetical protein